MSLFSAFPILRNFPYLIQLGINENQLYNWRRRARLLQDRSAAEERLLVEIARLKRQLAEQAEELAILKKAAAYFAKSQK
jgi:transposase